MLALAALALAVPERAQAQTLEDRLPSGDCRDLNEYPNCGIGSSIDQRAGGYSDGGAIQSAGDGDLWTVVLYRAQSYLIEVKGAGDPGGDNGGTLPDPWVEIYELTYNMGTRRFDPTLRASNDNVNATNKNAGVVYTYPPGTTPQTPIGIRCARRERRHRQLHREREGARRIAVDRDHRLRDPSKRHVHNRGRRHRAGGCQPLRPIPTRGQSCWRRAGEYQIDARGVDSGGGTLPDPRLLLTVVPPGGDL